MNRAQITRIVPVSDQILLLVFKDTQAGKHDVKFLLHQIPGIAPRSDPKDFKAFLYENKQVFLSGNVTSSVMRTTPKEKLLKSHYLPRKMNGLK